MWHTKQKQQQQQHQNVRHFEIRWNLTNDFIWRPPSQLIDQQQQDVKLHTTKFQDILKAVLSLFLQETTMLTTTTTFDSIEQVQSIDQLFWMQQQNKNTDAKKTRLQNINNNINFQTANVKMNVRRVEQNNNNNNRKTKWQMTAKWENKSGSSSPKNETTQHHMIMATTTTTTSNEFNV